MSASRRRDIQRRDITSEVEVTAEGVELDMDVLEIAENEWAIHGRLAYEGQVIAATFTSEDEAWTALIEAATTDVHRADPPR